MHHAVTPYEYVFAIGLPLYVPKMVFEGF